MHWGKKLKDCVHCSTIYVSVPYTRTPMPINLRDFSITKKLVCAGSLFHEEIVEDRNLDIHGEKSAICNMFMMSPKMSLKSSFSPIKFDF